MFFLGLQLEQLGISGCAKIAEQVAPHHELSEQCRIELSLLLPGEPTACKSVGSKSVPSKYKGRRYGEKPKASNAPETRLESVMPHIF